jgi:predicted flap endonuclease-1-like 5' DNA nuclease
MPEPNQESEIEADAVLELSDAPPARASETPPADNGKSTPSAPAAKDVTGSNPPQPSRLSSLPVAPPRPGAPSANPLKSDRPSSPPHASPIPRAPGAPSSSFPAVEKVDPLAEMQSQLEHALRALAAKEGEVRSIVAQRDQGIAEIESLRHQLSSRELAVKELEFAAMTRDTRIRELEKALDDAIAQARDPGDDLTQIRGIGPAFERELKRIGVRKFEQIAAWTPADIEDIAPKIKARRERIHRETWVAKAAELAARRRPRE